MRLTEFGKIIGKGQGQEAISENILPFMDWRWNKFSGA
jgi:hypothetical protein